MAAIDGIPPGTPSQGITVPTGTAVYRSERVTPAQERLATGRDAGVTEARDAISTPQARERDPELTQVVSDANSRLETANRTMRFRIHGNGDDIQIQIVDQERDKVIRSIPSDEMLRLSSRMRDFAGLGSMVDTAR